MEYICYDCPRQCGVLRNDDSPAGFCRSYASPCVVRAAPHFGEEPCISGSHGSGTIFFSGCSLGCVYCQNHLISRSASGRMLSPSQLREVILRLADTGVHNISFVTASHHVRTVCETLSGMCLKIPVVWNSSGYECVETLQMLEGLVQIYLPDLKYLRLEPAKKYSSAPDYPTAVKRAIREMFRQTGNYVMDNNGILQRGVLIRHLILPGQEQNTMDCIDFVAETFPAGSVLFSLMSQYTPPGSLKGYPELENPIGVELSEWMNDYMLRQGIRNGYWQEPSSATEELLPAFDGTGV